MELQAALEFLGSWGLQADEPFLSSSSSSSSASSSSLSSPYLASLSLDNSALPSSPSLVSSDEPPALEPIPVIAQQYPPLYYDPECPQEHGSVANDNSAISMLHEKHKQRNTQILKECGLSSTTRVSSFDPRSSILICLACVSKLSIFMSVRSTLTLVHSLGLHAVE